jgi:hypothetical protein
MIAFNTAEILETRKAIASKVKELSGYGTDDFFKAERLNALAAEVIMPWVEQSIASESITDLLLERQPSRKGDVKWPVGPKHKSFYVDENGDIQASRSLKNYITPEGYLIATKVLIDRLDLERGDVSSIEDQVNAAKNDITEKLNTAATNLLIAAASDDMSEETATLTDTAFDTVTDLMNDENLRPVLITLRATHGTTIKGWSNPQDVAAELMRKGVQGMSINGAVVQYAQQMPTNRVLFTGDKKAGRILDEFPLTVDPVQINGMQVIIPIFIVVKMAVCNPDWIGLIKLTS